MNDEQLTELSAVNKAVCPKCFKGFTGPKALQALRMHRMRVHTRAGKRGAKLANEVAAAKKRAATAANGLPSSATKEARRRYYHNMVARYHAQGLNSHGEPFSRRGNRARFAPIVLGNEPEQEPVKAAIKFCPHCGQNLEKHL